MFYILTQNLHLKARNSMKIFFEDFCAFLGLTDTIFMKENLSERGANGLTKKVP